MPPPKGSSAELLAAVAGGDRDALQTLYRSQAARLFGLAMAILRDRAAAGDALQEGFVRVWQRSRQFVPARADADTWLAAMVRQAALEIAREHGREAADDPSDSAVDPDALDLLATGESGTRLRDCLQRLEAKPRAAVVLGFVHGLSYAEITAQLNETPGTARSLLHRGLASIRDSLK